MNTGFAAYIPFREQFGSIDPARYPPEYIDRQVVSGAWRCWGGDTAAILAEIKTYPGGLREVHGIAAAGELAGIVGLIPLAEEWGREWGCVRAVIESRGGWIRELEGDGYCLHQVCLRKEL